ncbi:hydrogenase-4 component F [Nakamurella panacisegetis]|uniref:Hydrogenase-4 component F n=1 Tax=Nakamurella panacisegetis TaxID=1090615 RepID=A0A1H0RVR0_9ACTN|nr:proton-conducting transporter membrane subunit [Nakamurella panacisegetis]SDP33086.1 hydrogenase-4 component F [Nakamurella panacisegetis]
MATAPIVLPIAVPAVTAAVYALVRWRPAMTWLAPLAALSTLAVAIVNAITVTGSGPVQAMGGLLRLDALSAYMLVVIGVIASITTLATPGYLRVEVAAERATGHTCARHNMLVQLFLAVMALAVLAANLGVLWVAVEATTIVTAFLVGERRDRRAIEAAWKYVVICSAGIALALLGVVLLNFASRQTGSGAGLDWGSLLAAAGRLDPGVTRLAVVLLIVGFGTKAGLAPLHAWVPSAYSQAPAPVAALMSGVLSSVGFYAVLRVKAIADAVLGVGLSRGLLLVLAMASLLIAASLLQAQRDYRRMLAYSSIEHMGLIALGAAVGTPLAIAAVLLHILGHGIAKTVLFLTAGRIQQSTGSTSITSVAGLAGRYPLLAGCFGLGVAALIGLPPFSLFASELGIFRAGFASPVAWVMAPALLLVIFIAAALFVHTSRMLLGADPDGESPGPALVSADRTADHPAASAKTAVATRRALLSRTTTAVLIGALTGSAVLGLSAWPLHGLLSLAAAALQR